MVPERDGSPSFRQEAIRCESFYRGTSKISERLWEVEPNGPKVRFDMSGRSEGSVFTYVTLHAGDGQTRPLGQFDRIVNDAVTSLWLAGNRVVTARQICGAMTGSPEKPGDRLRRFVEESMAAQRNVTMSIDFGEEARKRQLRMPDGTTAETCFEAPLIDAEPVEVIVANGSIAEGYMLMGEPALYRHDGATGQILSYRARLLALLRSAGSDTVRSIMARHYLMGRLVQMRNGKAMKAKRISFETLFSHLDRAGGSFSRNEQVRLRKQVVGYLELLAQDGFIGSWCFYDARGKRISGVEVDW